MSGRGVQHFLGAAALGLAMLSAGGFAQAEAAPEAKLYLSDTYNETADPAADVQQAIQEADGRRILLEVGGNWCVWCKLLDGYMEANPDVRKAFGESFMIVKVNFSREHPNTEFLGAYPEAEGYPQFYVLDTDGSFLAAQGTAELEEGKGYNRARMLEFAKRWRKD
nr:thioredoxin family protein [uncultured Hyphomonas sp.]